MRSNQHTNTPTHQYSHSAQNNAIKNVESLQVIRGFAACFVLLFHGSGSCQAQLGYSYATNLLKFGSSGVDIFFVLSGFIIYYTSASKKLTVTEFLLRRCARIFPIYWVALSFMLSLFLVERFLLHGSTTSSTLVNTVQTGGLELFFKSILLIPNDPNILAVSWTLSYEIVFYLLFGLAFFQKSAYFMYALVTWVAFNFIHCFLSPISDVVININLFQPIVIEFLYGCIVAILILKSANKYWKLSLISGGILFIIAALSLQDFLSIPENIQFRVLGYGLPAALVISGAAHIKRRFPKFLTYLGDASYSIYLFHIPLLGIFIKTLCLLKINQYFSNCLGVTFILLAILFLCCLIYTLIEKPMLQFSKRKIDNYKRNLGGQSLISEPATNVVL